MDTENTGQQMYLGYITCLPSIATILDAIQSLHIDKAGRKCELEGLLAQINSSSLCIWTYHEWSKRIETVGCNADELQGQGEYVHCEMDDDNVNQMMKYATVNTGTASCDLPFMEIGQLYTMHDEEVSKYKVQDTYGLLLCKDKFISKLWLDCDVSHRLIYDTRPNYWKVILKVNLLHWYLEIFQYSCTLSTEEKEMRWNGSNNKHHMTKKDSDC